MWLLNLSGTGKVGNRIYWLSLARKNLTIGAGGHDIECDLDGWRVKVKLERSERASHSSLELHLQSPTAKNSGEWERFKFSLSSGHPQQFERKFSRQTLSIWCQHLTFCSSAMPKTVTESIKNNARYFDYDFAPVWSPAVTHLVMKKLVSTQKAIQALQQPCFIVSDMFIAAYISYFNKMRKSTTTGDIPYLDSVPDPLAFIPPASPDLQAVSWSPDKTRSTLFQDLTFWLSPADSEDLKKQTQTIIEGSAGKCVMDGDDVPAHAIRVSSKSGTDATLDTLGKCIMFNTLKGLSTTQESQKAKPKSPVKPKSKSTWITVTKSGLNTAPPIMRVIPDPELVVIGSENVAISSNSSNNQPQQGYKQFKKQWYQGKDELPDIIPCEKAKYDYKTGAHEPWLDASPQKTKAISRHQPQVASRQEPLLTKPPSQSKTIPKRGLARYD